MNAPSNPGRRRGWTAELVFTRSPGGRTVLRIARVRAPLVFTRSFAASDDTAVAMAWLQSTNGGLHAGDDVAVRIVVEEGASARVAPQSATVVGAAARGQGARTYTELVVEEGACLEWAPPPTVLLPGAQLDAATYVNAVPGAAAIVADVHVQHVPSPAPNAALTLLTAELAAVVGGRTLAVDRIVANGAWSVGACANVWSIAPEPTGSDQPNQPDHHDRAEELVGELLLQGFAAGELPNRAGAGIRLAGSAGAVHDASRRAIVAIRAAQLTAAPGAGGPTGLPSWTYAAPSPSPGRLRRDFVPRLRPQ